MEHQNIKISIDDTRHVVIIKQGSTGSLTLPYSRLEIDYPIGSGLRDNYEFLSPTKKEGGEYGRNFTCKCGWKGDQDDVGIGWMLDDYVWLCPDCGIEVKG